MTENVFDIFAEEEARRLAEAKAEIAREDAEYAKLSPEEKARRSAEYEAKYAHLDNLPEEDDEEEDEEDEDEEA